MPSGIFFSLIFLVQGLCAQDSLFQARFSNNMEQLDGLYGWKDPDFCAGAFATNREPEFEEVVKRCMIFSEPEPNAVDFYNFYMGLSNEGKDKFIRYFAGCEPFFDAALQAEGLSSDIKYLAPVLSAMNPNAVDDNSKAGVWQLDHFQGVLGGLQVNKLVDERFNEEKATRAFVLQLRSNVALFHSEELAVLAYVVGRTRLNNALARCGTDAGYKEVLQHLPAEVKDLVANFQAVAVFLKQNRFVLRSIIPEYDTVDIDQQLHFKQIAEALLIGEDQLQFLNPQFRYSIVPGNIKMQSILLPAGRSDEFVMLSDSGFTITDSSLFEVVTQKIEYAPAPNRQYAGEKVKDLEIEGKTKIKYVIQPGDVLGFIAEDYDVRVADLKYWNNIYNERKIQAGKKLDIFVDDENAAYYQSLQARNTEAVKKASSFSVPANARKVEHTVKSGESPYHIAKKYNGVTPEAILGWNGISDARKIQIGQKLIIYLAQ